MSAIAHRAQPIKRRDSQRSRKISIRAATHERFAQINSKFASQFARYPE